MAGGTFALVVLAVAGAWVATRIAADGTAVAAAGGQPVLLPPLPDLAPLENEVPPDGKSLKRAAKALAVLEELRRREAERDATRGEGHD